MPEAFTLNYTGAMSDRPRYYADDCSRDILTPDPRSIAVEDARSQSYSHCLEREGYELISHRSEVRDFNDPDEVNRVYRLETEQLLRELTAADEVVLCAHPVRRTTETSRLTVSGNLYNSRPANFVHVDISNTTATEMAQTWMPKRTDRRVRRFAHYNLWRVFSAPPQDMPLAMCDARSVSSSDLVEAEAVMDIPGKKVASYLGLVVRYNPGHRWSYFPDMNRDEILVFKTHDSDAAHPSHVPHVAFDNPACRSRLEPRASVEMRGIAYWYGS
jgi:hypothetical protein